VQRRGFAYLAICHEAKGTPEHVIVEMASDLRAQIVVVGIQSREAAPQRRIGSVAQAVVRDAGCPVLVVRPIQPDARAPHLEPACPQCLDTRSRSHGETLWCEQHREKHGRCHIHFNPRALGVPTQGLVS